MDIKEEVKLITEHIKNEGEKYMLFNRQIEYEDVPINNSVSPKQFGISKGKTIKNKKKF